MEGSAWGDQPSGNALAGNRDGRQQQRQWPVARGQWLHPRASLVYYLYIEAGAQASRVSILWYELYTSNWVEAYNENRPPSWTQTPTRFVCVPPRQSSPLLPLITSAGLCTLRPAGPRTEVITLFALLNSVAIISSIKWCLRLTNMVILDWPNALRYG